MNYFEKVLDGVQSSLNLNAATLSGAIDIIVVPQADGTLRSTPFHVRFGKLQLINSSEKVVEIEVNGEPSELKMKLGNAGEAFFVEETEEPVPPSLLTSPIASPPSTPRRQATTPRSEVEGEIVKEGMNESEMQTLSSKLEEMYKMNSANGSSIAAPSATTTTSAPITIPATVPLEIPGSAGIQRPPKEESPLLSPNDNFLYGNLEEEERKTNQKEKSWNMSWGWGTLPRVKRNSVTQAPTTALNQSTGLREPSDSDEELLSDTEDFPPPGDTEALSSSWTGKVGSLFRIFQGNQHPSQQPSQPIPQQPQQQSSQLLQDEPLSLSPEEIPSLRESSDGLSIHTNGHGATEKEVLHEGNTSGSISDVDTNTVIFAPNDHEEEIDTMEEPQETFPELEMEISECGHILGQNLIEINNNNGTIGKEAMAIFKEHLVSYEALCENSELLFDQNLLFRINNNIAGPFIVSIMVFRKPLTPEVVAKLEKSYYERTTAKQEKKGWSYYWWWRSGAKPQVKEVKVEKNVNIRKSLRPTSKQLASLKLKPGANHIVFSVTSTLQGNREVRAIIYLWEPDSKIVISDIDGTITKSDVFGQILPIIGRDWSHSGVASLYSNITRNNYKILYLTSRPIGQASITKNYINSLKQEGDVQLPQGPVFMSPNRLLSSLNQEVILRKPEEFKIACLKDIKSLFPSQPFYAGFGNRPTDALSYRAVGVPLGKIFTINYLGEISIVNYTYKKTFGSLNDLVNAMFPPATKGSPVEEQFNSWNYWKPPLANLQE